MTQSSQAATPVKSVIFSTSAAEVAVLLTPLKPDDMLCLVVLLDPLLAVDWLAEFEGKVGVASSGRITADVTDPEISCALGSKVPFICAAEMVFQPFLPMRR
jgi:hypothetical protein